MKKPKKAKSLRDLFIDEMFDLPGLKKCGFIQTKDPSKCTYVKSLRDYDGIERRIVTFFTLDSIYDYVSMNDEKPEQLPILSAKKWLTDEAQLRIVHN